MNVRIKPTAAKAILGVALTAAILLNQACASQRKLQRIREDKEAADIMPIKEEADVMANLENLQTEQIKKVDSLPQDGEPFIMNAILDEETGEMVATEELAAAMVVSRRYQVAERNGQIELPFEIMVPEDMMDSKWQVRLYPDLRLTGKEFEETTPLEPVFITGGGYREKQYKGYEQYDRFISTIITDSTQMLKRHQLVLFIKRNMPQIYALKADSTNISDAEFMTRYNVSAQEAIRHYTKDWMVRSNERKKADKERRFRRYVKSPIITDGIRLDTVIINPNGSYTYRYIQTIATRKDLKYAYIALNGSIYDQAKSIYDMPKTEEIEYPISSLSHFVKDITRYKMKTVWRRQEANSSYDISFALGKSNIDTTLSANSSELRRIATNLRTLMNDTVFDLDSIIVHASCSPEGRIAINERLSRERSKSVSRHFDRFMKEYIDSTSREAGFSVDENGNIIKSEAIRSIPFISRYTDENWELLDELVIKDDSLTSQQKDRYFEIAAQNTNNRDRREVLLKKESWYNYIKDNFYPKLRVVNFNFNLHRKGMVEEFVQTEEVDTTYSRGVQYLKDRDYKAALEILQNYDDYNSAVAYMAMDRNLSAWECLENEEETADVCYLKAIILSRFQRDEEACQYYKRACEMERMYIFRGNLDPEITVLIKKYGLNKEYN